MTKIDMRDAFFEKLVEAARLDERIIVLSADHGAFALKKFEEEMPERYINMGIAEQNMVGVAAGLAASGKVVFIYGISPFVSLRVLEQLTIDVAAMQLPVNVISVGAGFTYSTDGPTHQGLQDVSAIATIPGMTILNSSDPVNTRAFVEMAISSGKPHYIRIEKEKVSDLPRKENTFEALNFGFSIFNQSNSSLLIVTTGNITHTILELVDYWMTKFSIKITVVDVHRLSPFPNISHLMNTHPQVLVIEEAYVSTLGHEIAKTMVVNSIKSKVSIIDAGGAYYFKGATRSAMAEISGLSSNYLTDAVENFLVR